jgi:phosphoglycerol transferase MdoB-like AlkP superfamily enzyme
MNTEKAPKKRPSKLWVPLVLLLGIVSGLLLYFWSSLNTYYNFGFQRMPFQPGFGPETFGELHIILSSVSVALLLALLVVYAKTYLQTKANFIFGLLVVLFALLLQALTTFPVILGIVEHQPILPDFTSNLADILTIIAYTVFLYLSLE